MKISKTDRYTENIKNLRNRSLSQSVCLWSRSKKIGTAYQQFTPSFYLAGSQVHAVCHLLSGKHLLSDLTALRKSPSPKSFEVSWSCSPFSDQFLMGWTALGTPLSFHTTHRSALCLLSCHRCFLTMKKNNVLFFPSNYVLDWKFKSIFMGWKISGRVLLSERNVSVSIN